MKNRPNLWIAVFALLAWSLPAAAVFLGGSGIQLVPQASSPFATAKKGIFSDTSDRVFYDVGASNRTFVTTSTSPSSIGQIPSVNGVNFGLITPVSNGQILKTDNTLANGAKWGGFGGKYNLQTGTTYSPTVADAFVTMSNIAARVITLPLASSFEPGQILTIKDAAGTAGTANITINRSGSNLINASTSVVISSNYGNTNLVSDGANLWFTF